MRSSRVVDHIVMGCHEHGRTILEVLAGDVRLLANRVLREMGVDEIEDKYWPRKWKKQQKPSREVEDKLIPVLWKEEVRSLINQGRG